MNRTLTTSALMTGLLLSACATVAPPPAALLDARATLRLAEADATVLTHAPLELKRASDSLERANRLHDSGESLPEVQSAAHVANQQAKTAMALARAKGNDAAIAGADAERQRMRADMLAGRAQRAEADTRSANAQADIARQNAANAEQRAAGAEEKTAIARSGAVDARARAELLQQQLSALQATQTDRGMLVTLGDVLFETGRAEVKPAARQSLRKLADFLEQHPERSVLIEGHTDSVGTATANMALSLRRAIAVDAELVSMGLAARRAGTVGYGEDYPVADNVSAGNRALNRRVEIYVADGDQPVMPRR